MFLNEKIIDQYLCHRRDLTLRMNFDGFDIYIIPNKAHFLVTVEYHHNIIYQDWYNTWEQACAKFDSLCSKYMNEDVAKNEKE